MDMSFELKLDEEQENWWNSKIKEFRALYIEEPEEYLKEYLESNKTDLNIIMKNSSNFIFEIREGCWKLYLEDEVRFHCEVVAALVRENKPSRMLLEDVFDRNFIKKIVAIQDKSELYNELAGIIGEFSGKIMPYIYKLSLSTTNSRRSRAGTTFEAIIKYIISDYYKYPFEDQSGLGNEFYTKHNLKKMVDGIIPGKKYYEKDRTNCMVITMKTTLRERWQEVVEELNRTNINKIYLLTLDETITEKTLETMNQHNIKLVVYDKIKAKFKSFNNVYSYGDFFEKEIPHFLNYWGIK